MEERRSSGPKIDHSDFGGDPFQVLKFGSSKILEGWSKAK